MCKKALFLFITLIVLPVSVFSTDVIDVHIKGIDDGVKTSRQQDYNEAVLFAKREAIERAGVKIKSITTVKDMVAESDYIESYAEAVLMPGYTVLDMGYAADGTYQIALIGRVKIEEKKPSIENSTSPKVESSQDILKTQSQQSSTNKATAQIISNSLGMDFVYVQPGSFMMGSPSSESGRDGNEKQHRVTLTKGFYMQTTEVTVQQWKQFIRATAYKTEAETKGGAYIWNGSKWEMDKNANWDNPGFSQTDNQPVTCVSWNDIQRFIPWLNQQGDKGEYRLPTEAEWEYAARAGSTTAFVNGRITELECGYDSNLAVMGWYCGNSDQRTHPVAGKQPNAWGLYDMHGNVCEWCQDWYDDPRSVFRTDPTGPSSGSSRVYRGGSWYIFASDCRSAHRDGGEPTNRISDRGFRLALSPSAQ